MSILGLRPSESNVVPPENERPISEEKNILLGIKEEVAKSLENYANAKNAQAAAANYKYNAQDWFQPKTSSGKSTERYPGQSVQNWAKPVISTEYRMDEAA